MMRILVLLAAFSLVPAALAQDSDGLNSIVNYREYSDQFSSSGQPNEDQLESLAAAGFHRIIYLAFTDHDSSLKGEDRIVKSLGMQFVQIPVDWEAPSINDYRLFAGAMRANTQQKTLVHCQVNFRASSFSFLYRVLEQKVPIAEAKEDLNSVWVPDATWQRWIFSVLEDHGVSPHCESCLWEHPD